MGAAGRAESRRATSHGYRHTVHVKVTPEVRERLLAASWDRSVPLSRVVEEAIDLWLDSHSDRDAGYL